MPVSDSPGLRERKRVATRQAIQLAVLQLALDRGLEHVTIEEVSRAVDISPRTFFNYFVSKEAAIAGDSPVEVDDAEFADFIAGGPTGDLLHDLGEVMAKASDNSSESRDILLLRRQLHAKYPQLFQLRMAGLRAFEDQLAEVVAQRLAHDDPTLASDENALKSRARLITLVAFGALRHAWSCWADKGDASDPPLSEQLRESFLQLETLLVQTRAA